jgi:hypothetical protein
MTAVRILVVALNVAGGVLMGLAVHTLMGPDLGIPPRGPVANALWLAFHIGPCAALAGLAVASAKIGSQVLPITLVPVTLAVIGPGVLVARYEAAEPAEGDLLHGILTLLAVCVQYLVVIAAWASVLGGWLWRRSQQRQRASL